MVSVMDAILDEEFEMLKTLAQFMEWSVERISTDQFLIIYIAQDKSRFANLVKCDQYPGTPPSWHWCNPDTQVLDLPGDTPIGGGFFHDKGVICAPWNRLAYKPVDSRGPHSDWALASWQANEKTGGCKTLAAMALRISQELKALTFEGRKG